MELKTITKLMELKTITLESAQKYNDDYAAGKFAGSEARPYKLDAIKKFVEEIRPTYQYVDEYSSGNWVSLDIVKSHSKYGTNYIYIDHERKLWRTRQTISEFYGPCGCYD